MSPSLSQRRREVAWAFLKLGCLSFGGPLAHLAYFRQELVERRRWLDDGHYADLVALCQFLPGPASTQLAFALGKERAGLPGALLASFSFTLPSAALMLAFAGGAAKLNLLGATGWLHGLALAAVAVVAQALWGMAKKLCTDRTHISFCLAAASLLLLFPGAVTQVAVMTVGAFGGWWLGRHRAPANAHFTEGSKTVESLPALLPTPGSRRSGALALGLFAGLLLLLPLLAQVTHSRRWSEVSLFYRAGSLVFGGGHVILPLLRVELVPRGWLSDELFLAGYSAAQAIPGPLFTLSAYLGATMHPGPGAWLDGLRCLMALFLPSWLLVGGALPFWHQLRGQPWLRTALAGANAAVVGVLLAAFYTPVVKEGVQGTPDAVAALVAFGLLEHWHVPPWLVVAGLALAGQFLLS